MQLFYCHHIEGNFAYFSEEEARHCVQVLRKKEGDQLSFVDGKGTWYEGQIVETGKKTCVLSILKKTFPYKPLPAKVHLAVAPTKNITRFEWLLEKATEIGISEISPLYCQRSERKKIRLDRLEKIVVAAMKQSLSAWLPKVNALTPFDQFIQGLPELGASSQRCIAHCEIDQQIHLAEKYQAGKDVMVLIGPEGDFSEKELQLAFQHHFQGVSLGPSRLRTETAAVVACHTIQLQNRGLWKSEERKTTQ
ncbi:MAG: 16S rRNA (uracil(1498)-N(3))-methyltransferase [Bacteroidota bacterium]